MIRMPRRALFPAALVETLKDACKIILRRIVKNNHRVQK
jgi:hypothetical protein